MKIIENKFFFNSVLIEKLKNITMLKDDKNFVYKNAYITIETINPNFLFPCQYYILKNELNNKIELKEAFRDIGYNIFDIPGYIEFATDSEPSLRTILPPIIEESIESDGKIYPIINDGMHRVFLAMLQRKMITVVYIRGASEYYYAYPLPNGWKDVKIVSEIDKNTIKKIHRITDNKRLYRNFDSVFTNCSKPRGLNFNG